MFSLDTCEEAAVVLFHLLRKLKLLLGMFLGEFLPQVQRVLLFSKGKKKERVHQQLLLIHRKLKQNKMETHKWFPKIPESEKYLIIFRLL